MFQHGGLYHREKASIHRSTLIYSILEGFILSRPGKNLQADAL